MNEAEIRRYAELMQELGLTGLEITQGEAKVRLERSAPAGREAVYAMPDAPVQMVQNPQNAPNPQSTAKADGCVSVTSPLVGVFYAAPAEDAKPFVTVGDRVTKGQTLCIVEAMKLMNEIAAEEDGVIEEICVTNGQVVEFGTELFRLKR